MQLEFYNDYDFEKATDYCNYNNNEVHFNDVSNNNDNFIDLNEGANKLKERGQRTNKHQSVTWKNRDNKVRLENEWGLRLL